jgi:hypothetical protein
MLHTATPGQGMTGDGWQAVTVTVFSGHSTGGGRRKNDSGVECNPIAYPGKKADNKKDHDRDRGDNEERWTFMREAGVEPANACANRS